MIPSEYSRTYRNKAEWLSTYIDMAWWTHSSAGVAREFEHFRIGRPSSAVRMEAEVAGSSYEFPLLYLTEGF